MDPATFTLEFADGVVQGADNAVGLFDAQLPGFNQLERFFASAEDWSQQTIGVPHAQVVTELNTDANPLTASVDVEHRSAPAFTAFGLSGIQQDLLDPVLGLLGSIGLFTS